MLQKEDIVAYAVRNPAPIGIRMTATPCPRFQTH
jgi:hypothetical protein